jgi:Tol biopolymer transport system component
MKVRRVLALSAAVVCVAFGVSCGGGGGDGGGGSGTGVLVFNRADGIYELDLGTMELTPLLKPSEVNSFFLDPAVSPDGQRIAYIVQPPAQIVDGRYDAGSDLWVANRDGSAPRLVYEHEDLNALVRFPQWDGDTHVLAFVQEITFADGADSAAVSDVDYTVQRFDIATGSRGKLLDDAIAFALSPDGQRISYARFDPTVGEIFESVPVSGGAVEVLVAQDERLNPYNSPRYSPDGATIAFAAADQRQAAPVPSGRLFAPFAGPSPNGFPQDIWLVDAGGGKPQLLADLKEDLPSLAWSDDGAHIFVLGANGVYDIDVGSGAVTRLGEGAFHAVVDWAPAPG